MNTLVRYLAAGGACAFLWTLGAETASACEMCFGAALDTPVTRGISMAMLLLVGMVGLVGGGVGAFFYHVQRRSSMLERSDVVVTEFGDVVRVEDDQS